MARAEREEKVRSRWPWVAAAAVVAASLFFIVKGCAFLPWNSERAPLRVRVTVTRDFGTLVLKDREVEVSAEASALRALMEVCEVETAYGGGFVKGIDGLASGYLADTGGGTKMDWFFYLNGQMADVGSDAYVLREGDWVLFDYHSWEHSLFTAFLAGCFPEPFLHGYQGPPGGVVVLYAPGREEEARRVSRLLEGAGASPCVLREMGDDWRPSQGEYAVLVGTWKEMEDNTYIREVQENAPRVGIYAFFREGRLVVLDAEGREKRVLDAGAGLVTGTGPRLGDGRSVLLVSGTDEEGLQAALSLLEDPEVRGRAPVTAWVTVAGEGALGVPGEVE